MAKTSARQGGEYTVNYTLPFGVDLTRGGVSTGRFSYIENMYRDYDGSGGKYVESIPGYRRLATTGKRINAIYPKRCQDGTRALVVHSADELLYVKLDENNNRVSALNMCTVKDGAGTAFEHGFDLYFLDGERIIRVGDYLSYEVGSEGEEAYLPTVYRNGVEYEQRNLLSKNVGEEYLISSADEVLFGSPEMYYRITDTENNLCALTGVSKYFMAFNVTVPSYTIISGKRYRVSEIDDGAFSASPDVQRIVIGEGVTRIGKKAFADCTSLTEVYCPETLAEIDDNAFLRCTKLNSVLVGAGLVRLGTGVFSYCTALESVFYTSSLPDFWSIEGASQVSEEKLKKHNGIYDVYVKIPLFSRLKSVKSVTIGETEYSFSATYKGDEINGVIVLVDNKRDIEGKTARIIGVSKTHPIPHPDTISTEADANAIKKCTVSCVFDGRVFLSGNPSLPGTVFYSGIRADGTADPTYFGAYNHFKDGLGSSNVISMLCTDDYLAVFKDSSSADGSVFYHTPMKTESNIVPTVYPVSYIHTGILPIGKAISFCGNPVFLSRNGLSAIERRTLDLTRSISVKSHNVNPELQREALGTAGLAVWCGYLVIATGFNMYLADSRAVFRHQSGEYEYEWYVLKGLGAPVEKTEYTYRFSSVAEEGYLVHSSPESIVTSTPMSESVDGKLIYYTVLDGKKYAIYKDDEIKTDRLSPISAVLGFDDELLFFGTENGAVYVFNNDRRGVPPDHIKNMPGFSINEYKRTYGRRIHPYFYSFDGRAPKYAAASPIDDCNIPHLLKNSVKGSLSVKCAARGNATVKIDVFTDKCGYSEKASLPNSEVDFFDLNFATLSFSSDEHFTVPIKEKEKGWLEKQIVVSSEGNRAPIGLCGISYRFTVKGKIKNK